MIFCCQKKTDEYEQRQRRTEIEDGIKEADIVSARIAELLGERTFQFSPAEWKTIHPCELQGTKCNSKCN